MRLDMLVEGFVDEAVARRVLVACHHEAGQSFGKKGWTYIRSRAKAFDQSRGLHGLLTLVDLMDTGFTCPAQVVDAWLPQRRAMHAFRIVVREIESWILADRVAVASFLGIALAKVPLLPETLPDPKRTLVNLARGARSKALRCALVPAPGLSASEGPLYTSEMVRFVNERWNPDAARINSDSLDRCMTRLSAMGAWA